MSRSSKGSTVVELLIASVITSFVTLAMLAILMVNFKTNAKVTNVDETVNAMRAVKERLSKDVRLGRSLGDVYGTDFYDNPNQVWLTQGSDSFPSSRNPIYGNSQTPPHGWPGAPWPNKPYTLSQSCLIVQIPVGDNHNDSGTTHNANSNVGWPTMIAAGASGTNPVPTVNQDNVETHVYQVLPDPNNAGEWMMQYCSFPGYAVTGYLPAAHNIGPETIISGIVGPLDSTNQPKIFQYISKVDATGTPTDSIQPNSSYIANYTGVVVNLEIGKHQSTVTRRGDISLQPVGFKLEVFLRNNALATSTGQPQALW